MATTAQPASPGSTSFGDISTAMDTLKDATVELVVAYENDDAAYALAVRAGEITRQASQLEDVLNSIGAALQNLGS